MSEGNEQHAIAVEMLAVLKRIEGQFSEFRLEMAKLRGDVVKLRGGVLEQGDHEARIKRLEDAVFKKAG